MNTTALELVSLILFSLSQYICHRKTVLKHKPDHVIPMLKKTFNGSYCRQNKVQIPSYTTEDFIVCPRLLALFFSLIYPSQILNVQGGLAFLKHVISLLGTPLLVAHILVCSWNVYPYFSHQRNFYSSLRSLFKCYYL